MLKEKTVMSTMHSLSRRVPLAGRVALGALFLTLALPAQDVDPPSRVARLNLIEGSVSMQPAGTDQWVPGVINRPFTIGDYIYTDVDARAELHFDAGVLRIGPQTSFGLLNFDDGIAQISLVEGSLNLHIRRLSPDDVLEVDTPNAAVTLTAPGDYRISVSPNDQTSFVVVRAGNVDITGGDNGFSLQGGQSAQLSGSDNLAYNFGGLPDTDDFDQFCFNRDRRELAFHPRYVSVDMIGAEDLDENGSWTQQAGVGAVWYPNTVAAGWAPYRYGHWAWIEPWGWTWVDDASWGFAPFHYGRWAFVGGRWGWTPGPIGVGVGVALRPVYAPALVSFFGGGGFSVSINLGGGPSLGWVPLGPGEYFTPSYHVSATYFTQVNVSNTVIEKNVNITNIYNITYVNRGGGAVAAAPPRKFANMQAPNAVTVISQSAMASGQTVSRVGQSLPKQDLVRIQTTNTAIVAPPVAPTRAALAVGMGKGSAAPHPPAQLLAKPLFAKAAPPPPPIPFEKKQQFLATHAGQPFNKQELRASVPKSAAPPAVTVRKVSPQAVAASHQKPSPQNAGKPSLPNAMNAKPASATTQPKGAPPAPEARKLTPTPTPAAAKAEPKEAVPAKTTPAPTPEVRKVTPTPTPAAAKTEPKEVAPAKTTPAPAPEVRKVTPPPTPPAAKPEPREAPAKTTPAPAPEVRKVTPPPTPPAAKPEPKEAAPAKATTAKTTKNTSKDKEKKTEEK